MRTEVHVRYVKVGLTLTVQLYMYAGG